MRTVEPLLGTRAQVGVDVADASARRFTEDAVVAEVARLEAIFTVFSPDSALHAYRRSGRTDVAELQIVLDLAVEWQQRTGGCFDPRLQAVTELWDRAEQAGVAPSPQMLAEAVASDRPLGNLNAIAKGWIADRALEVVSARSLWLNLGGDVVHRGEGSIMVGVEDPHRPYDNVEPLTTLELSNGAVATSGGTRRSWRIAGQRYPKVLDPRTGRPVDHVASATVLADDAATADVLATVAVVASPEETLDLVRQVGADCLLVLKDRSVVTSSDVFGS